MDEAPQQTPAPQAPVEPPKFHDVTIATTKTYACARVEGVPPEEFGISRNARSIKDSGYCFHEVLRRQSDLIDQGFDAEQIKDLPSHTTISNSESMARDTVDEGQGAQGDDGINQANRLIKVTEHYIRMDYDGNDRAAMYRVTTGGEGDVLKRDGEDDIVEVDTPPFASITPVIVTHRFFGRSIADLVMDIQRIKTALLRGALDNLYLHNNPRVEVSETHSGDNTLDDLLVSRPGGIVRTKQPGGLNWQVVPDITGSVYPAMQYMDATREWRTGVSRQGQGTDPNALQNQVATIANQMFNAAQAKTKLIARIFAETGIRDMFSLLHGIIRKNGSQAETVKLRNKWVNVDPREWRSRDDMTVKVGLGDGSKSEQLAGAQLLITAQKEGIQAGLVSPRNLYNSAKNLTKLLGHKDVDEFFTAPGKQPEEGSEPDPADAPIPPPEDPKVAEGKAKLQMEQEKAKADVAMTQQKNQADQAMGTQKMQGDAAMKREQMNMEFELKIEQMKAEFALKREQMAAEMMLKREQMALDAEVQHSVGMAKAKSDPTGIDDVQMGGEVG